MAGAIGRKALLGRSAERLDRPLLRVVNLRLARDRAPAIIGDRVADLVSASEPPSAPAAACSSSSTAVASNSG